MCPDLGHAVHAGIGDLRFVKSFDHLRGGQRAKGSKNNGFQRVTAFIAPRIAVKARVGGQRGVLQHPIAKQLPFALVLQAKHHRAAVARLKRAVRVNACVRRGRARWRRGAFKRVVQRVAHPFGQ